MGVRRMRSQPPTASSSALSPSSSRVHCAPLRPPAPACPTSSDSTASAKEGGCHEPHSCSSSAGSSAPCARQSVSGCQDPRGLRGDMYEGIVRSRSLGLMRKQGDCRAPLGRPWRLACRLIWEAARAGWAGWVGLGALFQSEGRRPAGGRECPPHREAPACCEGFKTVASSMHTAQSSVHKQLWTD
jgi:hypothetical protein